MQALGREALCLLRCVSEHNPGLLAGFLEAGAGGTARVRVSMSGNMRTLLVSLLDTPPAYASHACGCAQWQHFQEPHSGSRVTLVQV